MTKRTAPICPGDYSGDGTVLLKAIIDGSGRVQKIGLIKGHPLLIYAAIEAVSQWEYRPYIGNGQPVEVETTVSLTLHCHRKVDFERPYR
ncbi:MAG TPA: energy transducer TonB [Terriglobales bacterium]|nr:energy transducer TonB [Terriglobales bacterium]